MLQVNVRVAYAACESADSRAQTSTAADSHEAGHDHGQSQRESPEKNDGSPLIACCQAMTSCGTVIDVGSVVESSLQSMTEIAIPAMTQRPMSRITAPEPPPPKA